METSRKSPSTIEEYFERCQDYFHVMLAGGLSTKVARGFHIYKELNSSGDYIWRWEFREDDEPVAMTRTSKHFNTFPDCLLDFVREQTYCLSEAAVRISEQIPGLHIWRETDKGWRWLYEDHVTDYPLYISDYYDTFADAMIAFIKWKTE
jgi:hypothetical protein